MGSETFVKQPAKEGFSSGGGRPSYGGKPAFKPQDQYTMFLSYAKDILVALQNTSGYDDGDFNRLLAEAVRGGNYLYEHRPGGTEAPVDLNTQDVPDVIQGVPEGPIDIADLDKVFDQSLEEQSWQPKS